MSTTKRFAQWMADSLGINDAVLGDLLSGGNANITQKIITAAGPMVLRRPPDAVISDKAANGIRREYSVLTAIGNHAPVPHVYGFCEDASILGAPFIVTEFVDGVSITDRLPDVYGKDADTVTQIGLELVDALAAIHRVDWQAAGLQEFGNPDNFIRRQIERWLKIRANDRVRDLPLIEELGQWLLANIPTDSPATIIHGDYHLDNTLFDKHQPRLAAVIDWELSTLGDPLSDLGLLLMFWGPRSVAVPGFAKIQQATRLPGVVSRHALATRWAERSGYGIDDLTYYKVFAFWRLAAIVEGAYCLYRRGSVDSAYARGLEYDVPTLLRESADVLEQEN